MAVLRNEESLGLSLDTNTKPTSRFFKLQLRAFWSEFVSRTKLLAASLFIFVGLLCGIPEKLWAEPAEHATPAATPGKEGERPAAASTAPPTPTAPSAKTTPAPNAPTPTAAATGATDATTITPAPTVAKSAAKSSQTHSDDAEPLEPWVEVTTTPTPYKKQGSSAADRGEPQDVIEESLGISVSKDRNARKKLEQEDPLRAAVIPNKISLSKALKKRLEEARAKQAAVVRAQRKEFHITNLNDDPRGEAEMRVCSVNFNNYGLAEDFLKTFRAKKMPARAATERSALAAIAEAGCTVVALQGIFGMDDKRANEGMEQFAEKLKARTQVDWHAYVGESAKELIRNGFLIQERADYNVLRIRTYSNIRLYRFAEFQLERAPRPPVQLAIEVKGKNGAVTRTVVLSTFDLRASSNPQEKINNQLPLAEASRMLNAKQREDAEVDDPPIVVMLGERANNQTSVAAKILEGSLHILDLTKNSRCHLTKFVPPVEESEEEESPKKKKKKDAPEPIDKVECSKPADYFKEFFGVVGETFGPKPKIVKEKKPDSDEEHFVEFRESPKAAAARLALARERTSEIYLSADDLSVAYQEAYHPGRYAVGDIPLKNGMPNSPLVWVDLNW